MRYIATNMAASLITFLCFSFIILNRHLFCLIFVAFVFMILQVVFYNNLTWIFGSDACYLDIELSLFSRVRLLFTRDYHKNIFYGEWNGTDVVIKEFPTNVESRGENLKECQTEYLNYISYATGEEIMKSLVVCPNADGLVDALGSFPCADFDFDTMTEAFLSHLLTENWPIPKSYGLWKNVLVQEYVGPSLSNLSPVDWQVRAEIAVGLLKLAHAFTLRHQRYSFYFTDISPDNIAIRENLEPVLIDLDHVIVVDRLGFSKESQHVSEQSPENEFIFSTRDICNNSMSDVNYYSICGCIFRNASLLPHNGLLTIIPKEVQSKYPRLIPLLQECAVSENRITSGIKLQELLQTILDAS